MLDTAALRPPRLSSSNTAGPVRMTRSGNRQLNAAVHRIAVTEIHIHGIERNYYRNRLDAADSSTEALRCLKRRGERPVDAARVVALWRRIIGRHAIFPLPADNCWRVATDGVSPAAEGGFWACRSRPRPYRLPA